MRERNIPVAARPNVSRSRPGRGHNGLAPAAEYWHQFGSGGSNTGSNGAPATALALAGGRHRGCLVRNFYIGAAVILTAGFAAAAIVLNKNEPEPVSRAGAATGGFELNASAPLEQRVKALEAAIAEERVARQLLEEELLAVLAELDSLRELPAAVAAPAVAATEPLDARRAEFLRERGGAERSTADRTAALLEAGFSPDRAAWIQQREDQLRIEAMQARFEAQRAGDMQAMFTANSRSESMLRAELGDREYEQYLEAYNRPTAITVGSVLESSPGQVAGLQPGDQIVRYDGQRVFSYADINAQQLQGEAGESIVVDILRHDAPMQIVMPRGPIGIQAGRRFAGR